MNFRRGDRQKKKTNLESSVFDVCVCAVYLGILYRALSRPRANSYSLRAAVFDSIHYTLRWRIREITLRVIAVYWQQQRRVAMAKRGRSEWSWITAKRAARAESWPSEYNDEIERERERKSIEERTRERLAPTFHRPTVATTLKTTVVVACLYIQQIVYNSEKFLLWCI